MWFDNCWSRKYSRTVKMGQKSSHLKLTDIYQLKNQTYFTENEIKDFYKEFVKANPTAKMAVEDLRKLYMKVFPNGDPSPLVSQLFRIYDSDKNGVIDFREFLCILSIVTNGSADARLRLAFSLYDQDDSGFITRDEYQTIMAAIRKAMGQFSMNENGKDSNVVPFERLDSNHDEQVSYEEFADYAKRDPKLVSLMTVTGKV